MMAGKRSFVKGLLRAFAQLAVHLVAGLLPPDAAEQSRVERSLSGVMALKNELDGATTVRLDAMTDASMLKGSLPGWGFRPC